MDGVQNAFKHNRARKNFIYGGAVILICITILSCVSSYTIYSAGFADFQGVFRAVLSLFAVVIVEGAFVLLVFGYTRALASPMERLIALAGLCFLVIVMLINLVTHFMIVKNIPLQPFQLAWVSWGAITVFIVVLLAVLGITLSDPVARLVRLELKYLGLQQQTILDAKTESLDSDRIREAMAGRAEFEAEQLARKILGDTPISRATVRASRPGFTSEASLPALGRAAATKVFGAMTDDEYEHYRQTYETPGLQRSPREQQDPKA